MEQLLIQATLLRAKRLARRLQDAQTATSARDNGPSFHQNVFPNSNFSDTSKNESDFSFSSSSQFENFGFEKKSEKSLEPGIHGSMKGK